MALNNYAFASLFSTSLCSNALHVRGVKAAQEPPGVFNVWKLNCKHPDMLLKHLCGQMTTLTQSVSLSAKASLSLDECCRFIFFYHSPALLRAWFQRSVPVLFMSLWMNIHRSPPPLHVSSQPHADAEEVDFSPSWSLSRTICPLENIVSLHFEMEELIFNNGFLQGPKPLPAFKDMLVFLEGSFKISI